MSIVILSVLFTGISADFFGQSMDAKTVAKIGKQSVTLDEFVREYKNQSYDIQNRFNFTLTEAQLKSLIWAEWC